MTTSTVREIENAIVTLSAVELDELYAWLADYSPQPIDARLQADFAVGHLDKVLLEALEDEKNGNYQPL